MGLEKGRWPVRSNTTAVTKRERDTKKNDADTSFYEEVLAAIKGGTTWSDGTLDTYQAKLQDKKSSLYTVDKNGLTFLHWAIISDCPGDVVRMLLGLGREVARQLVKGRLPLHMAIEANCNPDTLDALLDEYPEAASVPDMDMRYPIEMLVNNNWGHENPFPYKYVDLAVRLLQIHPGAARIKCGDRSLLQICVEHDLGETIILEVLRANRPAAGQKRRDGLYPLHSALLGEQSLTVVAALMNAHPQALLKRMKLDHEHEMAPIEHLIRCNRPPAGSVEDPSEKRAYEFTQDRIYEILTGGQRAGLCDPKVLAYARAAAMGLNTKCYNSKTEAAVGSTHNALGSQHQVLQSVGGEGALQRRELLKLYVKPFAREMVPIQTHINGKVEDLRREVEAKEGTPASEQCLILEGVALEDGMGLGHYNIKQEAVIDLRLRFDLLHQALRNRVEEEIALEILDMQPMFAAETDRYGALPLHLALTHRAGETTIRRLLSHSREAGRKAMFGGSIGEYPLHIAINRGYSPALIQELLQDTQPGDWRNDGTYNPSQGTLRTATGEANLMLPLLMALDQAPSDDNSGGCVPDDEVCQTISMLLASRCSITARDRRTGFSALDVATTKSERLFSLILLETLAVEPDAVGIAGSTGHCPLHVAVMGKAAKGIVNKLCEFRPDVLWMRDSEGRLPIHLACTNGASPAVVRTLIWHLPASVSEGDGRGRLPLQIAVSSKPPPGVVFELARSSRSARRARNHTGMTPLELAVKQNAPGWVVRELLQADPGAFKEVNLLSGNWPNNTAAMEAIRIVKQIRQDKRDAREARREPSRRASRVTTNSAATSRTEKPQTPQVAGAALISDTAAMHVDPTREHEEELRDHRSPLENMLNAIYDSVFGA